MCKRMKNIGSIVIIIIIIIIIIIVDIVINIIIAIIQLSFCLNFSPLKSTQWIGFICNLFYKYHCILAVTSCIFQTWNHCRVQIVL